MPDLPDFDRLRVVLVRARNPLNIGAAARAMSNFGFTRLRVVQPFDPSFREARSAVGAGAVLEKAEHFDSVADAVADCTLVVGTTSAENRELQHDVRPLSAAAALIRRRLASSPVALLFGSEKTGLSNEDFNHCHWLVRIPTRKEHGSMNLGQAVSVCLYELARSGAVPRSTIDSRGKVRLATVAEMERVTEALLSVLRASGYQTPNSAASTAAKVRRLVRRLNLQEDDAQMLLGMLRQIGWKVSNS